MAAQSSQLKMKSFRQNNRLQQRIKSIPPNVHLYVKKSHEIVDRIYEILNKKGLAQKTLAGGMDKHESEISKLLKGDHNFTLKTITKIEAILGENIVTISSEPIKSQNDFIPKDYEWAIYNMGLFNSFCADSEGGVLTNSYTKLKNKSNQWLGLTKILHEAEC